LLAGTVVVVWARCCACDEGNEDGRDGELHDWKELNLSIVWLDVASVQGIEMVMVAVSFLQENTSGAFISFFNSWAGGSAVYADEADADADADADSAWNHLPEYIVNSEPVNSDTNHTVLNSLAFATLGVANMDATLDSWSNWSDEITCCG
jgi:hypothetical protein